MEKHPTKVMWTATSQAEVQKFPLSQKQSPDIIKKNVMEKKIEKVFGSWDLEVDSYSYLVVDVEREKSTDF